MPKLNNQIDVTMFEEKKQDQIDTVEGFVLGEWDYDSSKAIQNDIVNINIIDKCKKLNQLKLYGVQLSTLDNYNVVKQIKILGIYGCNKITNFEFLSKCDLVQEFTISDMTITSVSMILYLKQLKKLSICHNLFITDFSALRKCTGLVVLEIWNTHISDISPIVDLKNLEELLLDDNELLDRNFQLEIKSKEEISFCFNNWKQTSQYSAYLAKINKQIFVQLTCHDENSNIQHTINQLNNIDSIQVQDSDIPQKIKEIRNQNFKQITQFMKSLILLREQNKYINIQSSIDNFYVSLQMLQNGNSNKLCEVNQHFIQLLNAIDNIK